jgi:hypothetical protein
MDDMLYKIKVRKGDFEIEVQGDREWVEAKLKELTREEFQVPLAKMETIGMPATLVEFLEQKGNPQRHTALVAVFAYWLLKAEKTESFNAKDIVSCYDRTRRVKPTNPNQIINTNVRSNLFAVAKEKKEGYKAWFLTHTGEEFVEKLE